MKQQLSNLYWLFALSLLHTAVLHAAPEKSSEPAPLQPPAFVRRIGQIAKLSPKYQDEFEKNFAIPPQTARTAMSKCGLRTELIYVKELAGGEPWAFRYQEYQGGHFTENMARLAADPHVQKWWRSLDECLSGPWIDVEEVFHTDGRSDQHMSAASVQRFGQVVGVRPEMIAPYKLLHAYAWPEVLAKITEGNIRNYSIYLGGSDSGLYLFAYFEYVGSDFAADMKAVDSDPASQAWIKFTDQACQLPIPTREAGEWWANMKSVSAWQSKAQ